MTDTLAVSEKNIDVSAEESIETKNDEEAILFEGELDSAESTVKPDDLEQAEGGNSSLDYFRKLLESTPDLSPNPRTEEDLTAGEAQLQGKLPSYSAENPGPVERAFNGYTDALNTGDLEKAEQARKAFVDAVKGAQAQHGGLLGDRERGYAALGKNHLIGRHERLIEGKSQQEGRSYFTLSSSEQNVINGIPMLPDTENGPIRPIAETPPSFPDAGFTLSESVFGPHITPIPLNEDLTGIPSIQESQVLGGHTINSQLVPEANMISGEAPFYDFYTSPQIINSYQVDYTTTASALTAATLLLALTSKLVTPVAMAAASVAVTLENIKDKADFETPLHQDFPEVS